MIARRGRIVLAGAFAVVFAGLTLASGVDRYSEHRPGAVRLVPGPFRVEAAKVAAAEALARGRVLQAQDHAAQALRRDPLDRRGIAFLAASRQLAGDAVGAAAAFRTGAALSWRDPLTQSYWLIRSLRAGDTATAAIRLDALLRANPAFVPAQTFLDLLERTPGGRRALLARLRADPRWAAAYLSAPASSDTVLRERARFIAAEARRGLALDCAASLPMVRELAKRNYRAEADQVLAAYCPANREATAVADAEFERFGEDSPSGLGWTRHGGGDARITPVGGRDRALELANRSGVTQLVLSQPVALAAGGYRVTGRMTGGGTDRLIASLTCGAPQRPAPGEASVGEGGTTVAAEPCPDQILGLWLRPGSEAVTIEALAIAPR